ncbi:polysaccharide deacetylase family protein [Cytobacillus dafuensis]|uniref:DUF4309 domain-containing protein n=1 Tax=Cytobacillus dafuensis TaxID=1742359 RepID=A0A5B8ZAK5_CYTDA|nr:polysaccharide deacetylase family protein [Cytobacillus dafuensis]QED49283.1 DUF4309 domain-containing protein [Cytobacillus dafuensis]
MNKQRIMTLLLCLVFFTVSLACQSEKIPPAEKTQLQENASQPKEEKPVQAANLDEIMERAQKGMTSDSPYNVLNSSMKQVKAEWGEPDHVDKAGFGYYATYKNKNVVLGFNESGQVFDIRSYAKDLRSVTVKEAEEVFGEPMDIRMVNDEYIYVYKLNENIELKLIIPKNRKEIDHISVFNSQMAIVNQHTGDEYTLDIKGKSNQLTAQAWEKMQNWREQIVQFSNEHENVYTNGPNKKMVALTFDDGPDEVVTPAIIDILNEYKVKGNFFFLGSEVKKYPDVVKEAYVKGNLVLSHSYNHVDLTSLSKEKIQEEVNQAGKAIQAVIEQEPAILRTPYGETNDKVASITEQEGYSIVLWSIDTLDWSQKESSNIVNNVVENVRNGDIILMHSDSEKTETAKALPLIIEALQEQNFEIVDLETLLGVKAYQ